MPKTPVDFSLFNFRPGVCPFDGQLMLDPKSVDISLNDGSKMPQPVCKAHEDYLKRKAVQGALLTVVKAIWKSEIASSKLMDKDTKLKELIRIEGIDLL